MKKFPKLTFAVSFLFVLGFAYYSLRIGPFPGVKSALADGREAMAMIPALLSQQAAEEEADAAVESIEIGGSEQSAPTGDSGDPNEILKQASERLITEYDSVRARLVETVAMDERKFRLTGSYLQGRDLKLRLDFTVQVGDSEGTVLEVCDGNTLWTRQTITTKGFVAGSEENEGDEIRITRRDVEAILEAVAATEKSPEQILVAELGLGGLPALLASLSRAVDFETAKTEIVDEEQFTVIEGRWNAQFLQKWPATAAGQSAELPHYVPDSIRIYFDQDSLFPRRILYLKKRPDRDLYRPMVTLDFNDVEFNAELDPNEFDYTPPDGAAYIDVTKRYLDQLNRTNNAQP